jgi:hypothetical protein
VKRYRSERPVKPRRPTRRSMAELAASLQSDATENPPLERPLATQQHPPPTSLGKKASVTTRTSLDYANVLVNASSSLVFFGQPAGQSREQEMESGASQREATEGTQEYREKAFKLMTASVKANLQYANKLTRPTTPFEFIELSTNHARKQFELIMSQTVAFGEFSLSLGMTPWIAIFHRLEDRHGRDGKKTS